VLPARIAALEDPEPEVRCHAVFALSACANPTALPALERLLIAA
jgi:HEAT repeat protein